MEQQGALRGIRVAPRDAQDQPRAARRGGVERLRVEACLAEYGLGVLGGGDLPDGLRAVSCVGGVDADQVPDERHNVVLGISQGAQRGVLEVGHEPILPCPDRVGAARRLTGPCRISPMSETLGVVSPWLSDEELSAARGTLPILYVEAVPVRVDAAGRITSVGLLLRARPDGSLSRAVVAGRVLYKERIRDALIRHLEKDLGPMALPRLPVSIAPFTIVEYFPDPTVTGFHDPRQHAVALAYVVPVDGDCEPSQSAIDLAWLTPEEATSEAVLAEFSGGQDRLIRLAMAFGGRLP